MPLKVNPLQCYAGNFKVPSSKPETQRAILISTLSAGVSYIYNDLRCSETTTMKDACRSFGARIVEHSDHLEIHGVGKNIQYTNTVIDCKGSGLVFRTFCALASVVTQPVVLTGDDTLCNRVMSPLFDALEQLGVRIESIKKSKMAPVVNWSHALKGGKCVLPGNISSQFITAILLAAPLADSPIEISVIGKIYSMSYIQQTIEYMRRSGINVKCSEDGKIFTVEPGEYQPQTYHICEDYTSASYILACACLFKGKTVVKNVHGESLQGERAILDIIQKLGMKVLLDTEKNELVIENNVDILQGDFEFDATDFPNIVPTLAALGSLIVGKFRVIGAAITRFHKASRVEAITFELKKLGVDIKLIEKNGICIGFEIQGKSSYPGGQLLSSWGDHRIFMSLFIISLKSKSANYLTGYEDVDCSFPSFLSDFENAGVTTAVVSDDISQESFVLNAVA